MRAYFTFHVRCQGSRAPFCRALAGPGIVNSHGRTSLIRTCKENTTRQSRKKCEKTFEGILNLSISEMRKSKNSRNEEEQLWPGRPSLVTTRWSPEWAAASVLSCHPTLGQPGHQSGAPGPEWSSDKPRPARETKHLRRVRSSPEHGEIASFVRRENTFS